MTPLKVIYPDWPIQHLTVCTTTRLGGVSTDPYSSLNLGQHVNDAVAAVEKNRALLQTSLGYKTAPLWLKQEHTTHIVTEAEWQPNVIADGIYLNESTQVGVVMTADCLPVVIAHYQQPEFLILHAGWQGLAAGIVLAAQSKLTAPGHEYRAWLGPAIGPEKFEVGSEVYQAFIERLPTHQTGFQRIKNDKYLCNLYTIAKQQLEVLGITAVYGGNHCTFSEENLFYSYRRDGITGRMATLGFAQA